jgi:2-polyprenyl-3-methyl-5-hydroxy-6-metoxy-1,4-benzoquinol methylase
LKQLANLGRSARRFAKGGPPLILADSLLRRIILASQRTPFRARGGYSSIDVSQHQTVTDLDKAKAEAADKERFYRYFPNHDVKERIRDAVVLDFGSGFGGRTIAYARDGAAMVYGVEPFQEPINASKALAKEWNVENVKFDLCGEFDIPHEDNKFDVVVTFDVLEHVADPRRSLAELHRVLKPTGTLFAVFPLYRGMLSHHLDYLTLVPGLHLIFQPQRIMRVVNELLDTRFRHILVSRHRAVPLSYRKDRHVLPMLNGMGLNDFKANTEMFNVEHLDQVSVARRFAGEGSLPARLTEPLMKMPAFVSEVLTFHICAVLRPKK